MSRILTALALLTALAGCASTAPVVQVPKEVRVPVLSCPAVEVPPRPVLAIPADRTAAEVVRAALLQIEQLKADNEALRALLAPYTGERTETPHEPSE